MFVFIVFIVAWNFQDFEHLKAGMFREGNVVKRGNHVMDKANLFEFLFFHNHPNIPNKYRTFFDACPLTLSCIECCSELNQQRAKLENSPSNIDISHIEFITTKFPSFYLKNQNR